MDRIRQSQDWGEPADGPMILDSMFWLVWLEELGVFSSLSIKVRACQEGKHLQEVAVVKLSFFTVNMIQPTLISRELNVV